ncbi:hypothetical protein [Sodalis sp.]|uniref:hypothetical protein n=1 Tax=Sodalis sp. (in: enterobacteria) TaxID=1898979 RepID=UPI00387378AA
MALNLGALYVHVLTMLVRSPYLVAIKGTLFISWRGYGVFACVSVQKILTGVNYRYC